ncbi:ABC transporter ATP-binding protein [Pseudonocardia sp. NPDC049635]|uniref:ABC transporter ATP-binding protein n=1 Tax=Pseudonocardia sp. NPDC049635 TaxID=3155506 RepID=UPI00340531B3
MTVVENRSRSGEEPAAEPSAAAGADPRNSPTVGGITRRRRLAFVVAAVLSVIGAAAGLAPYVAVYLVAAELFAGDGPADRGYLVTVAVGAAIALVVRAVAAGLATHVAHVAAYRVLADLRVELMARLRGMPLGRVQSRSPGELKKVLQDDVEQLEEAFAHGVPDAAAAAAVPLATTAVLFAVDWRLALVTLVALVLAVVVGAAGMAAAQKNNAAQYETLGAMNRAVLSYLQGMRVIRGFLRPDTGYHQAREAVAAFRDAADGLLRSPVRWFAALLTGVTALPIAALLPTAGLLYVHGSIELPTLVLFLLIGLGYAAPLFGLILTLATLTTRLQMATGSISEILAEPLLPVPAEPRTPVREPGGMRVEFDGVGFGYGEQKVVSGIDLEITPGSFVALVGETGAGKSTLARLVARFWDVDEGAVRVGGIDVREVDPAELMRQVALVQQDDYLFDDTVLENIRIGRPGATDEEVRAAGVRARVDEFADGLPQGWHTVLGSGGGRLSGGQRQRISIARALLKDSPVVVLDEATAFLDAENEEAAGAAVRELARDRTVIVIAHRLGSVVHADRLVLLEHGRILDQGTHAELLERSPRYRTMWDAYRSTTGWTLGSATSAAAPPQVPDTLPATVRRSDDPGEEWSRAAASIITPGLGRMGFFRQWRTLVGRGWGRLARQGTLRLVLEGLVRGAPVVAIFLTLRQAVVGDLSDAVVWGLTGYLVLFMVLRVVAIERANQVVWAVANQAKADVSLSILDRLRMMPLGLLSRFDSGRMSTMVNNDVVMLDFQNTPQQLLGGLVQPVLAAVLLFVLDWRLALAALAGLPLFLLLTAVSDRIYRAVFGPLHEVRTRTTSRLLENVRGAAVLRAYPDSAPARRYGVAVEELRAASVAMSVRATPSVALASISLELGSVLLILLGTALYPASLSATTLLLFLVLSLVLYQPLQELNALAGYRRNQQQIARRIAEVWEAPVLPEPAEPRTPATASVEFRDVEFSYVAGEQTLRGVSFTAEPGTVTALVGPSGSGKSTVANLVSRFWDVDSGSVAIGGVDVRELGSMSVLATVTSVYQDVYLFDRSVRFNVTLGRPDATDQEIARALDAAQCTEFVAALPDGLDTVVGEGGTSLSGGQRQRLSIARALLKDSPVLVLDEAVASVDPDTEARIQQAIGSLAAGRTVIVIAHRLDTVRDVDQIVVLDQGRVDGVGSHEELLGASPVYRRLRAAHDRALAAAEG